MLKLSKLTDYATVILGYMAKDCTKKYPCQAIAKTTGVAQPTVSKILKILVKANIVHSIRGTKGGYLLAMPPQHITIAVIIEALEGPFALTECSLSHKNCEQVADCDIQGNWNVVHQKILALLESITLADMVIPIKQPAELRISANNLFK